MRKISYPKSDCFHQRVSRAIVLIMDSIEQQGKLIIELQNRIKLLEKNKK